MRVKLLLPQPGSLLPCAIAAVDDSPGPPHRRSPYAPVTFGIPVKVIAMEPSAAGITTDQQRYLWLSTRMRARWDRAIGRAFQ